MVNTPFYIVNANTQEITQCLTNADNWIHGKFYNREQFLLKYQIHFCEDLFSHEDIYFSTLVKGILACNNLGYIQCDTVTYNWYIYGDSLSHRSTETGLSYLEEYYGEYIDSILEPVKLLNERYHNASFFSTQLLTLLLYGYFYIQGFLYWNGSNFKKDNLSKFKNLLDYTKDSLKLSDNDIIQWTYKNLQIYLEIRHKASDGTGVMIETSSYADFINAMSKFQVNYDN